MDRLILNETIVYMDRITIRCLVSARIESCCFVRLKVAMKIKSKADLTFLVIL